MSNDPPNAESDAMGLDQGDLKESAQGQVPEKSWQFHPLAAAWGFLLPGAGHLWLGETQRGLIIGGFIMGLFVAGLLIGGIDVIDRRAADAPFIRVGQIFLGPSWAADWCRLSLMEPATTPQEIAPGRYSPSLSRIQEQGVLYTAVAGLLNLMAIIDLVYRPGRERRR